LIRKLQFANTKAVSLIFVTAFFFYFSSEALLRQYVLSQLGSKELSINNLLARLPEGIRENVRTRIMKARLRDELATATTDEQVIFALTSLARLDSDEELEKVYAEIIEKYPSNPQTSSAFLYFFRGDSKLKSISIDEFHAYINRLPKINRFYIWQSGISKLKGTGGQPKEAIEFLKPLLDIKPEYKDYQQLYVDLAEYAFQTEKRELETRARKLEDTCDKLITIEQAIFEEEKKNKKKAAGK
jgi:hypothetical protein